MTKDLQLIGLYLAVCQVYNSITARDCQRLSNNFCPKFTDEECITIYLWGIANQKFDAKATYNFAKEFYEGWFPDMHSYQKFNYRIGKLSDVLQELSSRFMRKKLDGTDFDEKMHMLDSMPIVVANSRRSGSAKVASEMCDKGYCASKKMRYYGIKLHSLNRAQDHTIPNPVLTWISPASENDLTSAKEMLINVNNIDIYADKAYCDATWKIDFKERNVCLTTPIKMNKGETEPDVIDEMYNSIIASIRQPIESFFSWLQRVTRIQIASAVRSENGLRSFVFARLAVAVLF